MDLHISRYGDTYRLTTYDFSGYDRPDKRFVARITPSEARFLRNTRLFYCEFEEEPIPEKDDVVSSDILYLTSHRGLYQLLLELPAHLGFAGRTEDRLIVHPGWENILNFGEGRPVPERIKNFCDNTGLSLRLIPKMRSEAQDLDIEIDSTVQSLGDA